MVLSQGDRVVAAMGTAFAATGTAFAATAGPAAKAPADVDLIGEVPTAVFAFVAETWKTIEARQADLPGIEMLALAGLVIVALLFILSRFGVFRLFAGWAVHKARQRMSRARGEFASIVIDFLRVAAIVGGFAIVLMGVHAVLRLAG